MISVFMMNKICVSIANTTESIFTPITNVFLFLVPEMLFVDIDLPLSMLCHKSASFLIQWFLLETYLYFCRLTKMLNKNVNGAERYRNRAAY